MSRLFVPETDGRRFDFGGDRVSIKVAARDTGGAYSLMHWTVAARAEAVAHVHDRYEETFYVLSGDLQFTIGRDEVPISTGDLVRAPPGIRHGFRNVSDQPAELLVTFTPGGMEELFYDHRTDAQAFDERAYAREAKDIHGTVYEG